MTMVPPEASACMLWGGIHRGIDNNVQSLRYYHYHLIFSANLRPHSQSLDLVRAMGRVKHQDPSLLTPDLWAKVFAYLEDRPGTIRSAVRSGDAWQDRKQQRKQTAVHQLKLVCKQFNDNHASHLGLCADIISRSWV